MRRLAAGIVKPGRARADLDRVSEQRAHVVTATSDEVLVRADRAMYETKAIGRDRVAVYGRPVPRATA